jgi:branched-chain amino acid transport system substrate-binding protein
MMIFKKNSVFLGISVVIFAVFLGSCSRPVNKVETRHDFNHTETLEVKTIDGDYYIAIAAPLTGPYRELGNTMLEGAMLAVEEYNRKAEPKKRIGTLIIDDGGIVSEGLSRAHLIVEQNALGVIGHLNSEISIEVSNIYSGSNIPVISPASTNPKFTERPQVRGYVFRTIGTDRQLGATAAEFVLASTDYKKIAVLYNDRPYGVSVASEFVRNIAKKTDRQLVLYQTIPVRTEDHSATALKVAEAQADLIFFIGEYNDAGYLLKDLKKKLPNLQFLGAEGVYQQAFIDIAGSAAEGALVLGTKPASQEVQEIYSRRFLKTSSGYVASTYHATNILINAVVKNKFKDTEKIAKTISENKIFDPNGDLIEPNFVIYQVSQAQFVIK